MWGICAGRRSMCCVRIVCAWVGVCVGGWGGGSEDEKLAKVLMKEPVCEALLCLESGSKLWKAIW